MGGSVSPREPGAAAVAALERSLLPLPQCTGRGRRRRRRRRQQQHHRLSGWQRRRPRARRARDTARGEPGSDGEAPAGRPRLRRPTPPRPERPAPLRSALPCSLPAAAPAFPSRRGQPPRRGAASAQAGGVGAAEPAMAASELYTKVRRPVSRALGRGPRGTAPPAVRPGRGRGAGTQSGPSGTTPFPSISKSSTLPAGRPQRRLPCSGVDG